MHTAALVVAVLGCVAIIGLGLRFLLSPAVAMSGYGVAADSPRASRALTEIKGIRDIASGVVLLVVWAAGGTDVLGWALLAASITPVCDAIVVRTNGGPLAQALGIHGVTAVLLIAAGLVLALG